MTESMSSEYEGGTMLVECTGCGTTYKIAEEKVPPGGVKVRCPKCRVVFQVQREVEKEHETLGEKLFGKDVVRRPLIEEKVAREESEAGVGQAEAAEAGARQAEVARAGAAQAGAAQAEAAQAGAAQAGAAQAGATQADTAEAGAAQAGAPSPSGAPTEAEAKEKTAEPEPPDKVPPPRVEQKEPAPPEERKPEQRRPDGRKEEADSSTLQPEAQVFPFQTSEEDPRNLARALVSDILFYNREKRDKGLAEGKVLAYLGREIARSWELYKDRVGIQKAVGMDYFREAVNEILGEGKEIL
jgi:predicted Zn finger-like uncharacterized protein